MLVLCTSYFNFKDFMIVKKKTKFSKNKLKLLHTLAFVIDNMTDFQSAFLKPFGVQQAVLKANENINNLKQ